ncbi:MAG: cupin domain-containing protein [Hyphomicrobiales bacterium]
MDNQTPINPFSGRLKPHAHASFSGIESDILIEGDGSLFSVMDMTIAAGGGAPAHRSFDEDKLFQVVMGRVFFAVGKETFFAHAGESIFVSKGEVHGFSAANNQAARMTLVSTPGRHDRFFLAMSELPTPHQAADVDKVCEIYGQAIVGPVPLPQQG